MVLCGCALTLASKSFIDGNIIKRSSDKGEVDNDVSGVANPEKVEGSEPFFFAEDQ